MSAAMQGRKLTIADIRPKAPPPPNPASTQVAPDRLERLRAKRKRKRLRQQARGKPHHGGRGALLRRRQAKRQLAQEAAAAVAWTDVRALLDTLGARYPVVFAKPRKPLAIGTHRQLAADLDCDRAVLAAALRYWCTRKVYLVALLQRQRFALDGLPAGAVTEAERERAKQLLARINQREKAKGVKPPPPPPARGIKLLRERAGANGSAP